jgi:DNA-binding transcriptional regulator YiaG
MKQKHYNPEAIRIIREARNLSREEFAAMLGGTASRQLVHAWEAGGVKPSVEYLAIIVNALGLRSVDIFFVETDQQNDSQGAGCNVA